MSLPGFARRAGVLCAALGLVALCSSGSNALAAARPAPAAGSGVAGASSLPNFVPLVEKYGPAVVNIRVIERAQETDDSAGPQGGNPDDPLNQFFRRFGIPAPDFGPRGSPRPERGTGSGFIVSPDGYILTNAHVVADASQVTVKLTDRREFRAKVIGTDKRTDVAVIKIDAHDLPTVRIGNSNMLRPGQWVLAIGSPFNFDNSATAGIVSATARSLPNDRYVPFIQTDAAVNPGNSGGPLFNMRGEVVGINSQIFSQTGGYMGLSFAIPINLAMDVEAQLIKTGHVVRGRIGVTIQEVNAQLAESFGLDRPRGALVSRVQADGPSAKAGVKPGDVILQVNGNDIERYGQVSGLISHMKPGSDAKLLVWRNGRKVPLTVHVARLDEQAQQSAARGSGPHRPEADQAARLGLAVRPLDPREKQQFNTDGNLVVERVSGPAAAAGIEPGDIILGINGKPVKSVAELRAAEKKAGKSVALLIQRQDSQIFVPLRLG